MKKNIKKIKDDKESVVVNEKEQALIEQIIGKEWKKYGRVAMAALGVLPWVGSLLGAAATFSGESEQGETNKLLFLWVKEHEIKLKELREILNSIFNKFESFGDRIKDRIESEEYIGLIRNTFKKWDEAETLGKKEMLRKLITNAGGITIVQDDWVRMFLDWIEKYHELHFSVIAQIHKTPNITRKGIWVNIKGTIPREDSAEADLYKLLIRDLSTGGIIRQYIERDYDGNPIPKPPGRTKGSTGRKPPVSAFDDIEPYVLTQLGIGFVQYVMNELTPQIES